MYYILLFKQKFIKIHRYNNNIVLHNLWPSKWFNILAPVIYITIYMNIVGENARLHDQNIVNITYPHKYDCQS